MRTLAYPTRLESTPATGLSFIPEGDEDLLVIPPFLDRKAEVSPDDPLRICRKVRAKAA